jgi:hypothetical protein
MSPLLLLLAASSLLVSPPAPISERMASPPNSTAPAPKTPDRESPTPPLSAMDRRGGPVSPISQNDPIHQVADAEVPRPVPVSELIKPVSGSVVSGSEASNAKSSSSADSKPIAPLAADFPDRLPPALRRPLDQAVSPQRPALREPSTGLRYPIDPPLGYSGRSSIVPREPGGNDHFVPIEDRWRLGMPHFDRGGIDWPACHDYPWEAGRWYDPYNQNVLKGDYPIFGQQTFLNITATQVSLLEARQFPIGTTPFESTQRPFSEEFFGRPETYFNTNYTKLSIDLNHGNAGYKPTDWRIRLTPVFNINHLDSNELAVVNPNVLKGTIRTRSFLALEEWFGEVKLFDHGPWYDFVSARVGSQFFNSDFRGFIFADTNRAIRLFGTSKSNREQFNVIFFDQTEKDTNSELNTFRDRRQNTFIANYFLQDSIYPGYQTQFSVHWNRDDGQQIFDRNSTLVRPDPAGIFRQHRVDAVYLGWTGDGHIGRYNLTHAFYWALGRDTENPIANREQTINAQMAAIELSYDRDWARFRTSLFWASGDNNVHDTQARGFDAIFDNPNFAGGEFSYWQRQSIRLFGVNLVQRQSLLPNLRSSKIQGQSNFVNPGLLILNGGFDADITPRLKSINNINYLWFDKTNSLEVFTFDGSIDRPIGLDLSTGLEYRPYISNNIVITGGAAVLFPGTGFNDLFRRLEHNADPAAQLFVDFVFQY